MRKSSVNFLLLIRHIYQLACPAAIRQRRPWEDGKLLNVQPKGSLTLHQCDRLRNEDEYKGGRCSRRQASLVAGPSFKLAGL